MQAVPVCNRGRAPTAFSSSSAPLALRACARYSTRKGLPVTEARHKMTHPPFPVLVLYDFTYVPLEASKMNESCGGAISERGPPPRPVVRGGGVAKRPCMRRAVRARAATLEPRCKMERERERCRLFSFSFPLLRNSRSFSRRHFSLVMNPPTSLLGLFSRAIGQAR